MLEDINLSIEVRNENGILEQVAIPYNENNKLITIEDVKNILMKYGIAIEINDISVYQDAMTHTSYLKKDAFTEEILNNAKKTIGKPVLELREVANERLEFMGDVVIKLLVTSYLFTRYDDQDEGFMTRLKSKLENTTQLSSFAKKIGLDKYLILSRQLELNIGRTNDKILEDAFEAFIGALYFDQSGGNINLVKENFIKNYEINKNASVFDYFKFDNGFKQCNNLLFKILQSEIDYSMLLYKDTNYKDQLLQYYHKQKWGNPMYKTIKEEIIHQHKRFTVGILDKDGNILKTGIGTSKRAAEQQSSMKALIHFEVLHPEQINEE